MGRLSSYRNHSSKGFTIVELLIVIVVIGILAAITIVAYSGITQRANAAAAQSAAESASKKVLSYMVLNSDQAPTDLATAGITNSGNTTYQYSANSATNPQTFCLTATTSNVSYYVDNTTHTSPTAGGCPGQAQNGGVAVTNYAINPSAVVNTHYWSANIPGVSVTQDPTQSRPGSLTTGSVETTFTVVNNISTQLWDSTVVPLVPVTPGEIIVISAYAKSSVANRTMNISDRWRDTANTQVAQSIQSGGIIGTSWTRASFVATAPAGVAYDHISFYFNGQVGDQWWLDDVMVTKGSVLYNYADGNSPNWVWNGTPNASASTGPAL